MARKLLYGKDERIGTARQPKGRRVANSQASAVQALRIHGADTSDGAKGNQGGGNRGGAGAVAPAHVPGSPPEVVPVGAVPLGAMKGLAGQLASQSS